ncbi:MAG: hypothetical protein V4641_09780 [Pseudomonadota bacterium]
MLPFLKNRDDGVGTGPVETVQRKPDEPKEYDTLDAVAEDLLAAVEKKDLPLIKAALASLCEYVRDQDMQQDQNMGVSS